MQSVDFHEKAIEAIRGFPKITRRELGEAIRKLQKGQGVGMPLSRPMPIIGSGVYELRVRDKTGSYRAFYYTKLANMILVFHAFQKKSQKTPRQEIKLGTKRLKDMLHAKS